jgi:hypothetical protein
LFDHRRRITEHRVTLAGKAAESMIDALVTDAPDWSDDDLEDAFCARFGATMV